MKAKSQKRGILNEITRLPAWLIIICISFLIGFFGFHFPSLNLRQNYEFINACWSYRFGGPDLCTPFFIFYPLFVIAFCLLFIIGSLVFLAIILRAKKIKNIGKMYLFSYLFLTTNSLLPFVSTSSNQTQRLFLFPLFMVVHYVIFVKFYKPVRNLPAGVVSISLWVLLWVFVRIINLPELVFNK